MGFEEFTKNLSEGLIELYGDTAEVETTEVLKNNGIKYNGVMIMFKDAADTSVPVIETDSLYGIYESGSMSMDECVRAVYHEREGFKNCHDTEMIVEKLSDWKLVKDTVYPVLVSAEENKEMLKNLVSRPMLDLSVIYVIRGKLSDGCVISVKIRHGLLKIYGISSEELHSQAMRNLKKDGYRFRKMEDVIRKMCKGTGMEVEYFGKPEMYILTNADGRYGAAGILNSRLIKDFAGRRNFFILPSSCHEMIFVPASVGADQGFFDSMVAEVNRVEVSEEERLTDHSYYYDAEADEIRMCA